VIGSAPRTTPGRRRSTAIALTITTCLCWALPARADRVEFADGFENAATVQDLLQPGRWSYVQQENAGSTIDLSAEHVHSGAQAIRFFGHPPGRELTKSDVGKNDVLFLIGQTLEVEAWFYFEDAGNLNNITLIDAECGCVFGLGVGVRIRLEHGYPRIERGELGLSTMQQRLVRVPLHQWFSLRYRLLLGVGPLGHAKLWVNERKVIDRPGTTVFPGGFVDNIQVGLTANASKADVTLFVDDVTIRRIANARQGIPAVFRGPRPQTAS
jgi:hypothetical protein